METDPSPATPPAAQPTRDSDTAAPPLPTLHKHDSPESPRGLEPQPGLKLFELAIETDYELFDLFDDMNATTDYVIELYAEVNAILAAEMNLAFVVTFIRVWDDPADLFNEEDPLQPFQLYWNQFEQDVPRDLAQFFSGRRNFPYGGAAYLPGLCTNSRGYSVVGYALGFLPDPLLPDVNSYDLIVTAHEIGHNIDCNHTHTLDLDNCDHLDGPPRRGTIMSYCSQTISGGNATMDLSFHAGNRDETRALISDADCVVLDCNRNGIDDSLDLSARTSLDANGSGVPDECEDCNHNGVFDDVDISSGESTDFDGNGLPDECQPDCNANGVPDLFDIELGTSLDLYGNEVPDECEADCDGDGVSDYTQIQAEMSRDVNRDAILDACQDCDGDGVIDLDALSQSHFIWATGLDNFDLGEFHSRTGVRTISSDPITSALPNDLLIAPDRRIFVTAGDENRVLEFDHTGALIGEFAAVSDPTGMLLRGDGELLISSRGDDAVYRHDLATGALLGALVDPMSGGLVDPFGLAFDPSDGALLVTSGDGRVLRFDAATGAPLGDFVSPADNGGLSDPRGLVFGPNGNLLVVSMSTDAVLEFDGVSGAFVRKFNQNGTDTALTLDLPWDIHVGPDGGVYVSRSGANAEGDHGDDDHDHEDHPHYEDDSAIIEELHINSTRIFLFDAFDGIFMGSYVLGNDTGLDEPTGFDFMPDAGGDCNVNYLPDACDILAGTSQDRDLDGVPDECECIGDVDGDGAIGLADLAILLAHFGDSGPEIGPEDGDQDGDHDVDLTDLSLLLSHFGSPCPG